VLRRDRIVVILALTLLTALAWSYLLWLSADMATRRLSKIAQSELV
jgi:predicted metal-binding membrane protein